MPKVKAKTKNTVGLDDDGCDSGERLAAPRVIGKSKRGARLRSPVLRTIGTRSRPLLRVQSTVFGTGSAAMGIVGSAPQVSLMSNSENPFASLRVSIPSPVVGINSSASTSGPTAVSTAPSLAWPVQMQAPAYPAVPPRNFENHEFGRPSGIFAVSALDSHPTYGRLVSPTDEILSGTGFAAPSSSAASRSTGSLMPPPSTAGTAQMIQQRRSQSIVTEPRLTATPLVGGGAEWSAAASPGSGCLTLRDSHRLYISDNFANPVHVPEA
jgi:hypothetical protein